MKHSIFIKPLLFISGITAIIIGIGVTFLPVVFQSYIGIHLDPNDINLLSETRGAGGVLLVVGVYILIGIFRSRITQLSLLLSTVFYLGYALGRTFGLVTDGLANQSLIIAFIAELIIGILSLIALRKLKSKA